MVPAGTLQSENGIDVAARESVRIVDGTASRLRLGIAPCAEVLLDLPSYFIAVRGRASAGFSNLAPAVKWQVDPLAGKIDLSLTAGAGLPTGTASDRARLAALCPAALVARAWRRLGRERDADRLLFSGKVKEFCHDRAHLSDREGNRRSLRSLHRVCRRLPFAWRLQPSS